MSFIDWEVSQKKQVKRTLRRDQDPRTKYSEDIEDPSRYGSYSEQYSPDRSFRPRGAQPEGFGENESYQARYRQMNGQRTNQGVPEQEIHDSSEATVSDYQDFWKKLLLKRQGIPDEDLPRLGKKTEKQLASNFRQLSLIEGNLVNGQDAVKSIYIASCFHGEGRTTGAINTAYGLAVYRGRKVLLVDTNHQSPQIHRFFQAGNTPSLQDVLSSASSPVEAVLPTVYQNLYLLPAVEGLSVLDFEKFKEIITGCKQCFDFVVVDGQPILASSDFVNMAKAIDTVFLVVECEKTKWEVVQMAHEKLSNAGVSNLGVVLNKRKYYIPKGIYRLTSKRS